MSQVRLSYKKSILLDQGELLPTQASSHKTTPTPNEKFSHGLAPRGFSLLNTRLSWLWDGDIPTKHKTQKADNQFIAIKTVACNSTLIWELPTGTGRSNKPTTQPKIGNKQTNQAGAEEARKKCISQLPYSLPYMYCACIHS